MPLAPVAMSDRQRVRPCHGVLTMNPTRGSVAPSRGSGVRQTALWTRRIVAFAVFALALTLSGFFLTGAGCEAKRTSYLILLSNGSSPFWDSFRVGMDDGAKDVDLEEADLTAVLEMNDGTPQGQLDKLRQFGSRSDIVGVAVSAVDENNAAVADELRKLQEKGVHVVCIDADVDRKKFRDARSHYIGSDNRTAGKELGVAARTILAARNVPSGSYVQFAGRTGAHNARERMDGFKEVVGASYREADRMADDTDRTRARENVRNAIRNHSDLVALVGIWSYNAPAIVDVVKVEDSHDKHAVVVFDAEPIAITQMDEGYIDAMVVQNPYRMGYQAVRLLKAMHEKDTATIQAMFPRMGQKGGDLYDTGLKVVVPDETSPVKSSAFGAEFMTLAEFKKWLDKFGLTGS